MVKNALIGKEAPAITLPNADGTDYAFTPGQNNRTTVLFFYPESGSYGCTKEVCQFRDALSEEGVFKSTEVEIIGISPDPVGKQKAFVEKHKVTYPILSDKEGKAREAYHVGKALLGLAASSRVTFIIGSDGIVKDVYESTINYSAHHKFVKNWLEAHPATTPEVSSTANPPSETTDTTAAPEPSPASAPAPAPA